MCNYGYEVEMKMTLQVAKEFLPWLKSHMVEMLSLECFFSADLFEEVSHKDGDVLLRAVYGYKSLEDFKTYLDKYAGKMRGDLSEELKNEIAFKRRHFKKVELV